MPVPPAIVEPAPPRFAFSRAYPPLLTVNPGSRVRFITSDRGYAEAVRDGVPPVGKRLFRLNALTGPVAVTGAEPGDALIVAIEAIAPGQTAYAIYVDRWGVDVFGMTGSWIEAFPILGETVVVPGGAVPVRAMVGCIGVAPADGTLSSLSPGSRTGGNLDLRELEAGATIWLPVEVPGGLLFMGDLHAAMGIGEPAGAGLECAGSVTVRLDLVKQAALPGPRLETTTHLLFLGSDPHDLHEAKGAAVRAAWHFLRSAGVPERRAFALGSAWLEVRFGGPAGANVLAGFPKPALHEAGVTWT